MILGPTSSIRLLKNAVPVSSIPSASLSTPSPKASDNIAWVAAGKNGLPSIENVDPDWNIGVGANWEGTLLDVKYALP